MFLVFLRTKTYYSSLFGQDASWLGYSKLQEFCIDLLYQLIGNRGSICSWYKETSVKSISSIIVVFGIII